MEVKTGKRPVMSRSPSVGLIDSVVRRQRKKSLGFNRSSPSRSRCVRSGSLVDDISPPSRSIRINAKLLQKSRSLPSRLIRSESNTLPLDDEELEKLKEEFLDNMLELFAVKYFRDLSLEDTVKYRNAWKL